MAKVITGKSKITCAHQGTVTFTPGQQLLKVGERAVLVAADISSGVVTGCTTPTTNTTKPCTKVISLLTGATTKFTVGNQPVLLETARGLTDGLTQQPTGNTWSVQSAEQTELDVIP
jgi:hypothetical protein